MSQSAAFVPSEHPRRQDGTFAVKPLGGQGEVDLNDPMLIWSIVTTRIQNTKDSLSELNDIAFATPDLSNLSAEELEVAQSEYEEKQARVRAENPHLTRAAFSYHMERIYNAARALDQLRGADPEAVDSYKTYADQLGIDMTQFVGRHDRETGEHQYSFHAALGTVTEEWEYEYDTQVRDMVVANLHAESVSDSHLSAALNASTPATPENLWGPLDSDDEPPF